MSKWRYQPVIVVGKDPADVEVSLCEIHVNAKHELKGWTRARIKPGGGDVHELQGDICRMLLDAYCWEPVRFADLKVGMTFKRAVTMKQREALAKMIEGAAHNLRQAIAEPQALPCA